MRLDVFLKETRLIKRRTIAKQLCEMGKVSVNNKISKPSSEVKEGDVVTLNLGIKQVDGIAHFLVQGKRIVPSIEQVDVADA
jgi:ribosomal 50S subunit-recycling heat shock protein